MAHMSLCLTIGFAIALSACCSLILFRGEGENKFISFFGIAQS
jgi:hypothetical protein